MLLFSFFFYIYFEIFVLNLWDWIAYYIIFKFCFYLSYIFIYFWFFTIYCFFYLLFVFIFFDTFLFYFFIVFLSEIYGQYFTKLLLPNNFFYNLLIYLFCVFFLGTEFVLLLFFFELLWFLFDFLDENEEGLDLLNIFWLICFESFNNSFYNVFILFFNYFSIYF